MSSIAKALRLAKGPTEAQKEAGNYRKFHTSIHGLDVAIENLKGTQRTGKSKNGKPWSVKMPAHYGYIKGTKGADDDQVDVYLGPDESSKNVFVVNQKDHGTGKFDEHKVMLGFPDLETAKKTYVSGFSDGKGHLRIGSIEEMSIDKFKNWVKSEDTEDRLERASGGKIPKTHDPGKGAPKEKAIYVNAAEEEVIKRALGHAGKATKQGVKSFVDPSGAYGGDLSGTQTSGNWNGSGSKPSNNNSSDSASSRSSNGSNFSYSAPTSTRTNSSDSASSRSVNGNNFSYNSPTSTRTDSSSPSQTVSPTSDGLAGASRDTTPPAAVNPGATQTTAGLSPNKPFESPNYPGSQSPRVSGEALDPVTAAVIGATMKDPTVTPAELSYGRKADQSVQYAPVPNAREMFSKGLAPSTPPSTPMTLDQQVQALQAAKPAESTMPMAATSLSPSVLATIAKLMGYGDTQKSYDENKIDSAFSAPQVPNTALKTDSTNTTVPETMNYNPLSSAGYMTPAMTQSYADGKTSLGTTDSNLAGKTDSTFTTVNETPFRYDPLNTATTDALTPNPTIKDLQTARAYLNRVPDLGIQQLTMKDPADGHNMQGGLGAATFDSRKYNTAARQAAEPVISPAVDTPPERPEPSDFITGNMPNAVKALKSGDYSTRGLDPQTGLGVPGPVTTSVTPVGYNYQPDMTVMNKIPAPLNNDRVTLDSVPQIPSSGLYPSAPQNDLYGDMTRTGVAAAPKPVSNYYQGRWFNDNRQNAGQIQDTGQAQSTRGLEVQPVNANANPFTPKEIKAAQPDENGFTPSGDVRLLNPNSWIAKHSPQAAGVVAIGNGLQRLSEMIGGHGSSSQSAVPSYMVTGHDSPGQEQRATSTGTNGGTFQSALAAARTAYAQNPSQSTQYFTWTDPATGQTSTYYIGNYRSGGKVRGNNAVSNALRMSMGG